MNNMKYIEKVILENFQSHKNSVIEFDNQLNVIVGASDSGKTAILRGIKWALYNEPSGDYFIREGESECSVTVIFNDGNRIRRYRNKSKNIYYLYNSNNIETKFEGFGTTVPQEIIDKTGIKKILLDSDQSKAINLSDQLEGSFLLSERGSTRASSIGRLVGVNIIDDSLREALRDSRNLSNKKKNMDDNILKLEEELIEYEYLSELSKRIDKIEIIRNKIYINNKNIIKYKNLSEKLTVILQGKKETNYHIEKLREIGSVDGILINISLNIERHKYLEDKDNQLNRLKTNKCDNINIISSLNNIDLIERNIENTNLLYSQGSKLLKIKSKLEKIQSETYELSYIVKRLIHLDTLQLKANTIDNNIKELEKLTNLMDKKLALKKSLYIGNQYVNKLNDIDDISNIQVLLQDKVDILNKLGLIAKRYISNRNEISKETSLLNELKESVQLNLDKYKNLLLKQETCPLCFSNIDNDKINHIISHYK